VTESRLPIHTIGHIQSHGLLFALSEPGYIVQQVSTNLDAVLGIAADDVLGRSFDAVLGPTQFEALRSELRTDDARCAGSLRVRLREGALEMNCVAHRHDGVLIAELELLAGAHSLEPLNVAAHCRIPLSRMERASDIPALSFVAATEVRRLSGFERVMVYRFDEAWSGEVIAESVGSAPGSYFGLRFPASDIPAQARRLFLLNPLRAIADARSAPVPIVPAVGPLTGRPLDLSCSFLRSAAPVHIEYLANMGVRATMTVSVVVRGRLWGLIACHHREARVVDASTRSVCEHIGQIFASQVASRIDNAVLEARVASRALLESYMASVETKGSRTDDQSLQGATLLELLDADGFVLQLNDVVSFGGAVGEKELPAVIDKLRKLSVRGIATTSRLGLIDRCADEYASAATGALYIGLGEESGDYLCLLRRELVETVTWAGNPDQAVSADAAGALRPRTSFAAWRETVRGRSRPWSELQLENAALLREQLLRLRASRRLHKSEARLREKNRLLAMAEETAHVGHWRVDLKTNALFWSDEVYRTFGFPKSYVPTLDAVISYYHPDDREMVRTAVASAVVAGTPFTYEARIGRPDGTTRNIVANGQAECTPDAQVVAIFGVFTDVTESRDAERERRRLLERIGLATQAARVGIWEWDIAAATMVWDPIMFALYGLTDAAMPTFERWAAALHADDRAQAERGMTNAALHGDTLDTEFRVIWPSGEVHYIRAMATVIHDDSGAAKRMIGTNWDITEVRSLGDQLRQEKDAATFAAAHDALTGLLNRRGLEAWIHSKAGIATTVLYLDIDGFKAVNDRGGHGAGDETLKRVAGIVRDAIRESDGCGRMGGDEFLIALLDVSADETAKIIERITSSVARLCPLGASDQTRIGMSIGVGHLGGAALLSDALRQADEHLYQRKSERKELARRTLLESRAD
jgi:diguanylate cyclase (GGDEF)-like protein/PAS domain S-box-containing protein